MSTTLDYGISSLRREVAESASAVKLATSVFGWSHYRTIALRTSHARAVAQLDHYERISR